MESTWKRCDDVFRTCRRDQDHWCSCAFFPTSQLHTFLGLDPSRHVLLPPSSPHTSTALAHCMVQTNTEPCACEGAPPRRSWHIKCRADACRDRRHGTSSGMKWTRRKRQVCVGATPFNGEESMVEGAYIKPVLMQWNPNVSTTKVVKQTSHSYYELSVKAYF